MLKLSGVAPQNGKVFRLIAINQSWPKFDPRLSDGGEHHVNLLLSTNLISGLTPMTLMEASDRPFQPNNMYSMPFPKGRFGDGSLGVHYSALEADTCMVEVGFHLSDQGQHETNSSIGTYFLVE